MQTNTLAIHDRTKGRIAKGFTIAREQLTHSNLSVKMGAAILKGNRIIATGHNKNVTRQIKHRFINIHSTHAEMVAILNAVNKYGAPLTGCELFVYSERKNGELRNTKPCEYCIALAIEAGIKRVWYIQDNNITYLNIGVL